MNHPIKIGIVGFGRIVELVHLPIIKQMEGLEVKGVFDITQQRIELAERRGFITYKSLNDLLELQIDAILIATPPNLHYNLAQQALLFGKHVILEKPITVNSKEAINLRELANQINRRVTVFQNRRFDSDYLLVKQVIGGGRLGDILFVERRHQMLGSGINFGVKSFHPNWRNELRYGGGALLDWGVHLVDQLLQLNLGKLCDVRAFMDSPHGSADDYIHAHLKLDNGILYSMSVNYRSNSKVPSWVVSGTKGTLQIVSDKEAHIQQHGKEVEIIHFQPTSRYAGREIYDSFIQSINGKGNLVVTLDEAVEVMKVLDEIRNYNTKVNTL